MKAWHFCFLFGLKMVAKLVASRNLFKGSLMNYSGVYFDLGRFHIIFIYFFHYLNILYYFCSFHSFSYAFGFALIILHYFHLSFNCYFYWIWFLISTISIYLFNFDFFNIFLNKHQYSIIIFRNFWNLIYATNNQ